jgi:hypothetical protein
MSKPWKFDAVACCLFVVCLLCLAAPNVAIKPSYLALASVVLVRLGLVAIDWKVQLR